MNDFNPAYATVAEISKALNDETTNAIARTDQIYSRIESIDHQLKAFVCLTRERALQEAAASDARRSIDTVLLHEARKESLAALDKIWIWLKKCPYGAYTLAGLRAGETAGCEGTRRNSIRITVDGTGGLSMQIRSGGWQIKAFVSVVMLLPVVLSGCAGQVYVDSPSINQNSRVRYLIIHHTSKNFAESLSLLTSSVDNPVSAHYLIPESGDDTYPDKKLRVYRLVPESERAWHAGISYWNGQESLNDLSIAIEIVNQAYCVAGPKEPTIDADPDQLCFYPDFAEDQLSLLMKLVAEILHRHPDIKPTDIVGHADVAPDRKVDPGPRFPWQRLYRLGFGAWYDDETVLYYWNVFRVSLPSVATIQQGLHEYGYQIELTGLDDNQTRDTMRAFQMHFRPSVTDGRIDAESAAVLFALLEKYRPERLQSLLNGSAVKNESGETGE